METASPTNKTVKELKAALAEAGLATVGLRDDLLARLDAHLAESTDAKKTGKRTKTDAPSSPAQSNLLAPADPKPTGGGKQEKKHNAALALIEATTALADIHLKAFNGERTRAILHLSALLPPSFSGLPKDIALAAKGLWQAAGTMQGRSSIELAPKRVWSLQVYDFNHGTTGTFLLATEVKGDPKVSVSDKDLWRLTWKVSVDLTKADLTRVHNLLRADTFHLTTRDAQTDVEG